MEKINKSVKVEFLEHGGKSPNNKCWSETGECLVFFGEARVGSVFSNC